MIMTDTLARCHPALRISLKQAVAPDFDPTLFSQTQFDRIFISYLFSKIPGAERPKTIKIYPSTRNIYPPALWRANHDNRV